MSATLSRPFSHSCALTLAAVTLGFLCGCGSGIGLPGTVSPNTPAPVASTNGPQLGYFWNASDQTLRPVLGIPGSSRIGQSVVPAGTYAGGAASSASGMAVLQEPDNSLDVMSLPSGQPQHLTAVAASGAQFRFSPNGKSAILFTPGSASLLLVTKLSSTPAATTIAAPFTVQEAALSDTGSIAVATASAFGASIQLLSTSGSATSLASVGALGGLAFASGDDLLYSDAAANTLTITRNASTKPSPALVPTTGLLKAPSGLGVSSNGQWVLLANSAEASTVRVDLTAQTAPLRIACSCTPALVSTMSGSGTFRVTAPNDGPLWAIEATASTPRSFFIPAVHP